MNFMTYLINLDEREDRLNSASEQLSRAELSFQRISAVHSSTVPESYFLTPGVHACWLSHMKTYREFLSSNHDYALILEDDFVFNGGIDVAKVVSLAEKLDLDLLQIGYLSPGFFNKFRWSYEEYEKLVFSLLAFLSKIPPLKFLQKRMRVGEVLQSNIFVTRSSFMPGTHAYVIDRRFAEALVIEGASNLSADEYFIAQSKMRSFKIARVMFSYIGQSNSSPSIGTRFKSLEIN